jgi:membrane fusion protein, multidrug efflux system
LLQELAKADAKQKTAEAEAHIAAMNHKNTLTLAQKNIVSQTEVDLARAKLEGAESIIEEAKAEVSGIRLKLSFTEVRAPFGGTINRLPLKVGSIIENGSLLTTLTDNSEVFAYFKLSEHEYLDNLMEEHSTGKPNKEVSLVMANGTPFPPKGTIETTESEVDSKTGNIAYRARFANPTEMLKHGSTAKVILSRKIHNVILVPQKSTYELQDKVYVMVVDAKGIVKSRKINVMQRRNDVFIVNQGLESDELIMLEGAQKVKDGDLIVPQPVKPTALSTTRY